MEPIKKTIIAGDTQYTFRLPTGKDMIQMDLLALRLRDGMTDGLSYAYRFSRAVGMLSTLCVDPKEPKFDELMSHDLDDLDSEVTEWVNSFRKNVGDNKAPAGAGSGA